MEDGAGAEPLAELSVVGQNYESIKGENTDPNERDKSRSHCKSESAQVQLEGDGRHHEAVYCNCKRLHQMDAAKFNRLLKFIFCFSLLFSVVQFSAFAKDFRDIFFFTLFTIGGFVAVTVAVVALCVDVRRPGFKLRPVPKWMVSVALWLTHYKRREWYYKTTRKLLPHGHK